MLKTLCRTLSKLGQAVSTPQVATDLVTPASEVLK